MRKTRSLGPEKAPVYWTKATRFSEAAEASFRTAQWDPAVSTSVHAVISALDALSALQLGRRSASEKHDEAVFLLDEMHDVPVRTRTEIAKIVKSLLAMKHLAEYEDRLCDEHDAHQAVNWMRRGLQKMKPHAAKGPTSR